MIDNNDNKHPVILTITGPSGSGKTVLSNLLKQEGFETLISTTTRSPREGEVHGVDYYFISKEKFLEDLNNGKFIEDIEYNNTLYGVSALEATRAFNMNKPAVLVAEPHGVEQIKEYCNKKGWNIVRVFVDNPEEVLLGRLLNRLLLDTTGNVIEDNQLGSIDKWTKKLHKNYLDDNFDLTSFLTSFVIENAQDSDGNKKIKEDYKNRISAAANRIKSFKFEQINWVEPARLNSGIYEYVTNQFNKDVQFGVIDDIIKIVEKAQKKTSIPYKSNCKFK